MFYYYYKITEEGQGRVAVAIVVILSPASSLERASGAGWVVDAAFCQRDVDYWLRPH